ncbi:MAG TPA: tetratricopeptide repeat protein [Labilithrix sp.]|jgi:tetratricopeptide (TPR) repeat protein
MRLAALVVLAGLAFATPAWASSALELVRIAKAHESAHEEDLAIRSYMEALALDPTCDDAYLGLGSLRTRRGDLREAERVYSVALEHEPQLRAARTARAWVRRALGFRAEAIDDLLGGAEDDVSALRVLAGWHAEDGQTPAQLAVWRLILARADETHDAMLRAEAKRMVRALVILVGPADPAASPPDDHGVRRVLAKAARGG